ncbi:hypothetical protein [uncultured Litoreibacter sp.]|uniref:hypothetical protein n=1 Tax=uncultured Litoreibacter sp. TaxID=1392394 RepID=UPI002615261E|nr:hypothetical protein [uncultured Litoreibacter sp.]
MDIVKPFVSRTSRGSVRSVAFSQQHLDEFLQALQELPLLAHDVEGDFYPIAYACQCGVGLFEDAFIDLQADSICGCRHPDKAGIGAV